MILKKNRVGFGYQQKLRVRVGYRVPVGPWSRDFCQFFNSLGIGIGKFGLGKKVSVSVSKNLVSEKKSRFRYRKIWSRKKSLGIGIEKFGLGKKVTKKKWAKVARTCL